MKEIEFYDTRSRKQRPFTTLKPGHVGMYTCGPTVYAPQHVGNIRSRLLPDLIKRFLQSEGYEVTHVINITDVGHLVADADVGDDKMEVAARKAGLSAEEIAEKYTQMWRDDCAAVNCISPEENPKATDHIPEQIELGKRLEERGYLYTIADGVYFDTSLFPRYAELAGLDLEGQQEGARIGVTEGKKNPSDFAVWKFADPDMKRLQEWDSPWGRGFPGWHLECSAMSVRYLGERFDIHTAGIDLATVHHSNEVAQTECGFEVHPSVEFWMHNEFLDMGGEKMSKSKGNVKTLSNLSERGFDPLAFRYFFLQAHYRQQQAYTYEAIEAAARGLRRLQKIGRALELVEGDGNPGAQAPLKERFRDALADDLNAPRAMAVVWEVARSDDLADVDRRDLLRCFDLILGLRLGEDAAAESEPAWEQDPEIDGLLAERERAREVKDWATADRIRDELTALEVEIIDTPEGARWRRIAGHSG
ncbi:MAG: cysteine--tRNA ligase [Myxococcales bacterium]|nr:cysteine--tRNA ligase [Myxococcales bacterium]HIK85430.1 cysteine--tRNA ligase [Myxococcales bacterium]